MAKNTEKKVLIQKIRVKGSDSFYSIARFGPKPDVSKILKGIFALPKKESGE